MSPHPDLDRIFKAYDVRGVVPDELDEDVARRIGAAFAEWAGASRMAIGRDCRLSSPALAAALTEGATSRGVDVVDLGLASTDLLYFASGSLDVPGAMLTASHSPPRYNGLKFCLAGARPVGQDTGLADIRVLAERDAYASVSSVGRVEERNLLDAFADHVLSLSGASRFAPLTVVADTANGMGGLVVPAVFERLPVTLIHLFPELDGTFPNHPADPLDPENQRDLKREVVARTADAGLAFDGDADRVPRRRTGRGRERLGDHRARRQGHAGAVPGLDGRAQPDLLVGGARGDPRERWDTGSRTSGALVHQAGDGGDRRGLRRRALRPLLLPRQLPSRLGLIAAVVALEALSLAGRPLSEVLAPFRRYHASGEINSRVDDQTAKIEELAAAYRDGKLDRTDGLTVEFDDWWFNVRPSNTEPLLRLNVEARTAELLGNGPRRPSPSSEAKEVRREPGPRAARDPRLPERPRRGGVSGGRAGHRVRYVRLPVPVRDGIPVMLIDEAEKPTGKKRR